MDTIEKKIKEWYLAEGDMNADQFEDWKKSTSYKKLVAMFDEYAALPQYDFHDGGKVNCHPQFIEGFNAGAATKTNAADWVEIKDGGMIERQFYWVCFGDGSMPDNPVQFRDGRFEDYYKLKWYKKLIVPPSPKQ